MPQFLTSHAFNFQVPAFALDEVYGRGAELDLLYLLRELLFHV